MKKSSALFFAVLTIAWMVATAIAISYNVWLSILFAICTFATMAAGFIVKRNAIRKKDDARLK